MKKISLTSLLMVLGMGQATAQNSNLSPSLQGNNELKLNILYTILGSPEITYERILSEHNAVGVSAEYRLFDVLRSDFNFGITPYFRHYFGVKKASGFFFEGNMAVFGYDGGPNAEQVYVDPYGNTYTIVAKKETFFGAGGSIGTKFLTKKGFTGDFSIGGSFGLNDKVVDFMPRIGLTLGKRF